MKTLVKKIALNFSSTVLPLSIGLWAIPLLIDLIGLERFGLLSIAWMIVGYFGLLDMGLGRALTQKIAAQIGFYETNYLRSLIVQSLIVILVVGVLGALLFAMLAEKLVFDIFTISQTLHMETIRAFYWLSLTIPFVILSTSLFGILEGQLYFGWIALLRAPLGVMMFLAPLAISHYFSQELDWLLASLFLVRLVIFVFLSVIVFKTTADFVGQSASKTQLKSLFIFGGWISVSNLVSPMMVYFDRFYIAAILSASVVAFYTTPFDLLTKLLFIPAALVGVMFASFATDWLGNPKLVVARYKWSLFVVFVTMLPIMLVTNIYAFEGMSWWLGADFAQQSYQIVQWLSIGVLLNALAMVPFAFVQATGRADITAKIHLLELPIYVLLLWFFIDEFGLLGAAMAWTIRVAVDLFVLFFMALLLQSRHSMGRYSV